MKVRSIKATLVTVFRNVHLKRDFAISLIAALVCHVIVLFVLRFRTPVQVPPANDGGSAVNVSISDLDAPLPPTSLPAPDIQQVPEIVPPPEPQPVPDETAPPVIMVSTPQVASEPIVTPQQPRQEKPKARPRSSASSKKTAASSANSTGAGNAGGAISGSGGSATGPRYRNNPCPDYPSDALRMKQEGVVMLNVFVSTDGHAANVTLKQSSGVSSLDEAALRAVRRWTFEPAQQAGLPVASEVEVPVHFRLQQSR